MKLHRQVSLGLQYTSSSVAKKLTMVCINLCFSHSTSISAISPENKISLIRALQEMGMKEIFFSGSQHARG